MLIHVANPGSIGGGNASANQGTDVFHRCSSTDTPIRQGLIDWYVPTPNAAHIRSIGGGKPTWA